MFHYFVYGLNVASDWPVPGLLRASGTSADIILKIGAPSDFRQGRDLLPIGPLGWLNRAVLPDGSEYLLWPNLFEFLVSPNGRSVLGHTLEEGTSDALEVYLFGQVISFALIKLGIEPIHGCAVVIDDRAIGILGDCSYGKSTLAAAFLRGGFRLLTDDLLVTSDANGDTIAHPGPPRIKLLPESAHALLGDAVEGTRMNAYTHKFIVALSENQSYRKAVPLSAMYVLSEPAVDQRTCTIDPLSIQEGCIELLRNTFNSSALDSARNRQLLQHHADLASRVPVRKLNYPRTFESLPNVIDRLLDDVRSVRNCVIA